MQTSKARQLSRRQAVLYCLVGGVGLGMLVANALDGMDWRWLVHGLLQGDGFGHGEWGNPLVGLAIFNAIGAGIGLVVGLVAAVIVGLTLRREA